MNIRLNGPFNLEDFNAFFYADLWIKAGNFRTDDTTRIPKRSEMNFRDLEDNTEEKMDINDKSVTKKYFNSPNLNIN